MNKILLPIFILSVVALACNLEGIGGGGGMEIKHEKGETSISPKSGFVAPNSSGGHSIQITNYPVEMGSSYDYSKIRTKENGQYRIDVMIIKKVATSKQPLSVGEYRPQDSKETPKDKVVRATIHHFDGGKVSNYQLATTQLKGTVKISSVEGGTAKGTIDLTDGKSAIKGDFTAKTLE